MIHLRIFELSLSPLDVLRIEDLGLCIVAHKLWCVVVCLVLLQLDVGIVFKVVQVLVLQGQGTLWHFPRGH